MSLSRSEQQQTEFALRKGDKAREERISVVMGQEESARVEHAQQVAQMHRATIEEAIADALLHETAVDLEMSAASGGKESGIAHERARCLAICAQWPDNLMAAHIAKMIASGK